MFQIEFSDLKSLALRVSTPSTVCLSLHHLHQNSNPVSLPVSVSQGMPVGAGSLPQRSPDKGDISYESGGAGNMHAPHKRCSMPLHGNVVCPSCIHALLLTRTWSCCCQCGENACVFCSLTKVFLSLAWALADS